MKIKKKNISKPKGSKSTTNEKNNPVEKILLGAAGLALAFLIANSVVIATNTALPNMADSFKNLPESFIPESLRSRDTLLPPDARKFLKEMQPGQGSEQKTPDAEAQDPPIRKASYLHEDGSRTVEYFTHENLRTRKAYFDEQGRLQERWNFDTAENRIERYEVYHYEDEHLKKYRIATWDYKPEGGFVKTNRIYNGTGKKTAVFYEYSTPSGVKYKEEWFNAEGNLTARKHWDPESGDFEEYILLKSYRDGQKKVQWLGQEGTKLEERIMKEDSPELSAIITPANAGV